MSFPKLAIYGIALDVAVSQATIQCHNLVAGVRHHPEQNNILLLGYNISNFQGEWRDVIG